MTSTASAIGNKFVLKYYTILSEKPESLWHFFKNFSEFTYGSEEDILPDDTVVGAENISHKIESSDFKDCKVSLSVVDCHDSINGSVVVVVIGWLSNKGEAPRKFVQTFLLAVQEPAGYYVHNSVFRYLKGETSPVLPNPNQAQPLHQLQPPKPTETKQEKEPEVAVEKSAPAPAVEPVKQEEPKQSPPVEEVKKEEIPPVKQEPPVPVVEKEQEKPAEPQKKPENKEEKQVPNRRDKKEKEKGKEKEKEKETQKPAAKAEEKSASQPVGWAAIVTKTVSSKSEPQQPPVQAPKPKAKETKEQAPKEKEAPKEAPKEVPKEAPKESPKEANNHSEIKSEKAEKKPSKNASSTSGFLPLEENLTVFVSNIPFQATEEQVRECFSKAGEVRSVVVRAKQGYCFVEFSTAEVVQKALQLAKGTQFLLDGRVLSLEEKKPNWEGGWKKEPKKDFKKKPQGSKSNGNGKPKEIIEKDNKPKKPYLKEGIVSQ